MPTPCAERGKDWVDVVQMGMTKTTRNLKVSKAIVPSSKLMLEVKCKVQGRIF